MVIISTIRTLHFFMPGALQLAKEQHITEEEKKGIQRRMIKHWPLNKPLPRQTPVEVKHYSAFT